MVACCRRKSFFPLMYSRLPSNEQVVKAWFRDYSSGLSSVGIQLGLTPRQQAELEHRLMAVCRDVDRAARTKENPGLTGVDGPCLDDPIKSRWVDDQASVQGDSSRHA